MIINKQTLSAIFKAFNTLFNQAFDSAEVQWNKIAMATRSTGASETYAWLGKTTQFREWIGDRVIQNLGTHDYTIKNKKFENTVGVDRDSIEDDGIGVYDPMIKQLGMDSKEHPESLVFELLKNGFSQLCYDGQYFFDTDHPVGDGSASNMQAGAGEAWYIIDTSRSIKPLIFQTRRDYKFVAKNKDTDENVFDRDEYVYGVDARVSAGYGLWQLAYGSKAPLTAANYEAARTAMRSLKGDNGKPLNIKTTMLVVAPELESAAKKIVAAEKLDNGASNTNFNTTELMVSSYLA